MSRWKAAAIHLSISATIGVIVGALLFGVWYPPPYFHAAGADELVLLLVGVDLTLGPLLTLVVFKSGKRGLKFDLAVIGIAQTAALVYGLSVVLVSRPVFLVGVLDRFVLVAANEISDDDLAQGSKPEFRSRSWTGPRLVAAELPTDDKERSELAFSALAGRDAQNLPKYYRDYSEAGKALLAKAKPLDVLRKKRPGDVAELDAWLAGAGRNADSVVWLPVVARKSDLVMLMDAQTAAPLKALPINPW
ncbi:MAG TPA: TfpX/TfpZ family type IV pilin accessory protein [Rudaea sp.]|nr:TfpX/TfpZ family type IV pilin accessory protein [Rudaea sp.]